MENINSPNKNISVMIVDDSTSNLEILSAALTEWGYGIRPSTNGNQAITAAQNNPPDLILLDIMMPDIDGYEICKRLKENSKTKHIPVIFITGMNKMDDEIKGFSFGAVDYITKPVQLPVLKSRVETHVQLKLYREQLEKLVYERTKELNSLIASIKSILIGISKENKITHWNREAEILFKMKSSDVLEKNFDKSLINWDWERVNAGILTVDTEGDQVFLKELWFIPVGNQDTGNRFLNIKINSVKDLNDKIFGFLFICDDITEVRTIRMQAHQAQKLEAIGQLASGIAHEINTPAQYIRDNTLFIQQSMKQIMLVINRFVNLHETESLCKRSEEMKALLQSIDYEFMLNEIPKALEQSIDGIERISKISSSMKNFSHPAESMKVLSDVDKIIEDAVTISKNEWKYVSEIDMDFAEDSKQIECFPDDLSRVILNLIVNSVHAIEDKIGKHSSVKGKIKIFTKYTSNKAIIIISDNGIGIPEENKDKIYDPFFTTKEIGRGTGQGLSIVYDIIVNRHKGQIHMESSAGDGTSFTIILPV